MPRATSLLLAGLLLVALAGCNGPTGRKSMWNIVEEMEGNDKLLIAELPPPPGQPLPKPLTAVKDADMPCLKTCHDKAKWATGKPYPHLHKEHQNNGKHCVDCHAIGHRSAVADRKICKECH